MSLDFTSNELANSATFGVEPCFFPFFDVGHAFPTILYSSSLKVNVSVCLPTRLRVHYIFILCNYTGAQMLKIPQRMQATSQKGRIVKVRESKTLKFSGGSHSPPMVVVVRDK